MNETTNSEMSFDSMFNAGASHYEKFSTLDMSNDQTSSVNEDIKDNISGDVVDTQPQQQEANAPAVTPEQVPATSTIDYKQLYDQLKLEKESYIGLLNSRLNDLSDKYQNLKGTTNKQEVDTADQEYVESLREFKEVYPDIAKAVEYLIKKEVDGTRKTVEDKIGEQVAPIRQYLEQSTKDQYLARITNAHPDIQNLIDSGVIYRWVGTLDPVKQAGAQTIMNTGTADQVIALINEYKLSNGNVGSMSTQNKTTPLSSQSNRDEEIAKRVMQLLSVPSNNQGPDVKPTQSTNQKTDYTSELLNAMKTWEDGNRR